MKILQLNKKMQWIEFAVNREYLLGILYMLVMIMNVDVEMLFDCFCYTGSLGLSRKTVVEPDLLLLLLLILVIDFSFAANVSGATVFVDDL